MYKDVDAVIDMPACLFWDELHEAFPDAKIILTMRENEDIWWKSSVNQFNASMELRNRVFRYFSPSWWRARTEILNTLVVIAIGFQLPHPLAWNWKPNEQMAKKLYRSHNAYVMQTAPKDKLLVYKCSEGWEPLCKFLGMPVPDRPFPRKNVRGNFYNEMSQNPVHQRLIKEVKLSILKYGIFAGVIAFSSYKYGLIKSIRAISEHTTRLLEKLWAC